MAARGISQGSNPGQESVKEGNQKEADVPEEPGTGSKGAAVEPEDKEHKNADAAQGAGEAEPKTDEEQEAAEEAAWWECVL